MAIYTKVYTMMEDLKARIIKTMQERGINEINFVPVMDEWLRENPENDEDDYEDFKMEKTPSVIYFDKYGCGIEYSAIKVTLCKTKHRDYYFKIYCEGSEDNKTFIEYDLTDWSMLNVCDFIEDVLNI